MGNCSHKQINIKKGELYDHIKAQIRPFDLLMFKGNDFVSSTISKLEKRGNKFSQGGEFTHAGIVVTSDIIYDMYMIPGKLYVLESTISGKLGSGVKNIYNQTMLGVQVRDLDLLIDAYDKPNNTNIAWCPLLHNPIDLHDPNELKHRMSNVYNGINGQMWDANCWSLLSALYPCMRPCRSCIESSVHTEDWLICSEMVAYIYKQMGILPDYVNPKDVIPADLTHPYEDTDKMPVIVKNICYITTPLHQPTNVIEK